jgi:hypothetical protein
MPKELGASSSFKLHPLHYILHNNYTMSAEGANPRINYSRMSEYLGRNVRIPCKVISVEPDGRQAIVETSDRGQVSIHNTRAQVYC